MTTPTNYIATWFYKESKEDASFYPQAGKRGDSALVHSIYMQIQVPFSPLSDIIIRMTSCFSSAIWISFPIIWSGYSRSYRLKPSVCPTSASRPRDGTEHGETSSTCMTSCAIWRKECRQTIHCSSATRTVSACVRWSSFSAIPGNMAPPCTTHPTDRTSA